jgi:hypothetical protein
MLGRYGLLAVAALCASRAAVQARPVVEFNADYVIACRDVTPSAYAQKYPDRKLVEATLRLSARVVSGSAKDLDGLLYTFEDPHHRLRVADYGPKTQLASDRVEPALAVEYAGRASVRYALTQQAGFLKGDYQTSKLTYHKLPPLEALVASGITERGYGVFYKLAASDRVTLEGDREFSCLFEVPRRWRGNCLLVRCEATALNRGYLGYFDPKVQAGLAGFVIGLYLDGDESGERLARSLAEEQQKHLTRIAEHDKTRRLIPSFNANAAPPGRPVGPVQQAMELNCHLMEAFLQQPAAALPFFERLASFQRSVLLLERRDE